MSGKGLFRKSEKTKQPVHIYGSFFTESISAEATPAPLVWRRNQAARHRIIVDIVNLLGPLFFRENIEVVEPWLPEVIAALRLADEQMEVFRHNDIAAYVEDVSAANLFENGKKEIPCCGRCQEWLAPEAATGDVMEVAATIVAFESSCHKGRTINLLCNPK